MRESSFEPRPARDSSTGPHPSSDPHDSIGDPPDPVLVGRIVGAWGVRGWVRVAPFNDPRLSLLPRMPTWWLRDGARTRAMRVEAARPHGAGEIVARIAGIDDRDAANALEGSEVLLSRAQFPAPEHDEVYWADLIGCTVLDPDGASLGAIVSIEDQPAHPLMRVVEEGAPQPHERLIPLVPEFLLSVDLDARVVVADWRSDY